MSYDKMETLFAIHVEIVDFNGDCFYKLSAKDHPDLHVAYPSEVVQIMTEWSDDPETAIQKWFVDPLPTRQESILLQSISRAK